MTVTDIKYTDLGICYELQRKGMAWKIISCNDGAERMDFGCRADLRKRLANSSSVEDKIAGKISRGKAQDMGIQITSCLSF